MDTRKNMNSRSPNAQRSHVETCSSYRKVTQGELDEIMRNDPDGKYVVYQIVDDRGISDADVLPFPRNHKRSINADLWIVEIRDFGRDI